MSHPGPHKTKEKLSNLGPLELPAEAARRHKGKGLAAFLLLLWSHKHKDLLLVFMGGTIAVFITGVAAVKGKLLFDRPSKQLSAIERSMQLDAKLRREAEAEQAAEQAANAAKSYGLLAGVPGKARSKSNVALGYLSYDRTLIKGADYATEGAEDQRDKESGGGKDGDRDKEEAGAVRVGGDVGAAGESALAEEAARGDLGKEGAGSLVLATPGEGLFGGEGGGIGAADGRASAINATLKSRGNAPTLKGGKFTPQRGRGGKLTPMQARRVNARIQEAGRRMNDPERNTRSKSMWQLVRATAYTMASLCPNCNRENVAVYNRAYATGESVEGVGVVLLPEESGVTVNRKMVNQSLSRTGGGAAAVVEKAEDCAKAVEANGKRAQELIGAISALRWSGGMLNNRPKKCCKVGNYNDKVDEYKRLCGQRNSLVSNVNPACQLPAGTNITDPSCSAYQKVKKCSWLKCFLAMIFRIVGFLMIVVALLTMSLGAALIKIAMNLGAGKLLATFIPALGPMDAK